MILIKYIDLRSDTVTLPPKGMLEEILKAPLGDDVYDDDPTVNRLQSLAAEILGKEAALLVPSGTMGNQLAIMTHTRRGDEIIAGQHSHCVENEVGAAAILSGVSINQIDNPQGIIYPQDILMAIREDNIHYPKTSLLCLENPLSNGTVIPLEIMRDSYALAKEADLAVHLDGARIFNGAIALGVDAKELAACGDSVMFCLSKGLAAPIGSLLAGSGEFINRAKKNRKILGGGMRQAGIIAACGIFALENTLKRLHEDHENALYLAKKLSAIPFIRVDMNKVQINMVFFKVEKGGFASEDFVRYMFDNGVKVYGIIGDSYRFVTHEGIKREDIDKVINLLILYIELGNKNKNN